jgi:hypothetical protein
VEELGKQHHAHARYRAFSNATGYDSARPLLPIETDELDTADETLLLNTYCKAQCIGAARILQASAVPST